VVVVAESAMALGWHIGHHGCHAPTHMGQAGCVGYKRLVPAAFIPPLRQLWPAGVACRASREVRATGPGEPLYLTALLLMFAEAAWESGRGLMALDQLFPTPGMAGSGGISAWIWPWSAWSSPSRA